MLRNLFKPKWQHSQVTVRQSALTRLNPGNADDLAVLKQMALADSEAAIRAAAVAAAANADVALAVLQHEQEPKVQASAATQLAACWAAANGNIETDLAQLSAEQRLLATQAISDRALAQRVIAGVSDPAAREALCVQLAQAWPQAQLRLLAAEQVTSEVQLEVLEKACKGRDKAVWRLARERLSEIRRQLQEAEGLDAMAAQLCETVESLSRLTTEPGFEARLQHAEQQWQRVQQRAPRELQQRFERARKLCQTSLDHARHEEAEAVAEAGAQRAATHERMDACEQLEMAVERLNATQALSNEDLASLQGLLTIQQTRWDEAAAIATPADDERKRYLRSFGMLQQALTAVRALHQQESRLMHAIEAVRAAQAPDPQALKRLRRDLQQAGGALEWPAGLTTPPLLLAWRDALQRLDSMQAELAARAHAAQASIATSLERLDEAVSAGQLKQARRLLQQVQRLRQDLPSALLRRHQADIQRLTAAVRELQDWQGYVASPKKEALCAQMEGLLTAEQAPDQLFDQLKALQNEWKALRAGDDGGDRSLWQRFKVASDAVYARCQPYLDAQQQLRQHNQRCRQTLCEQLEAYLEQYDWAQPDWAAVAAVFQGAKREWGQYNPVPGRAAKPLQKRFNAALDQLKAKLEAEYARNRQRRQQLIEAATAAQTEADLAAAIATVKDLQRQWRECQPVARRDDGRLWKQFRRACDAVFARRDNQREEQAQAHSEAEVHAEHLLEQMEQLLESDQRDVESQQRTQELANAQQEFNELCERFQALPTFSASARQSLQQRFTRLQQQFQEHVATLSEAEAQLALRTLRQRARQCDAFEQRLLAGQSIPDLNLFRDSWLNDDCLSESMREVLAQRLRLLETGRAKPLTQSAESLQQARDVAIELEILAGVPSPGEDSQRRMEMQVNRLQGGLAQRNQVGDQAQRAQGLLERYSALGPLNEAPRQQLDQRLQTALAALGIALS